MSDNRFLMKRGNSNDFKPRSLMVGELAAVLDKHSLVFCFGENDCKELNFDENVTEETARELIDKITEFFENSTKVTRDRLGIR